MPQLRKDPISDRWVIVDVENPRGADSYQSAPHKKSTRTCPFCPGNEGMTPPEITVYGRKPGSRSASNWLVRVVPNKFPALRTDESTDKYGIGVYDKVCGFGAHEVIIENPDHEKEISDLPVEHVELILRALRDRFLTLKQDKRFKYIIIFKNYGAAAGASLEHPHVQLMALPVVPSRVFSEVKGAHKHFEDTDRCLFSDILNQERAEQKLTVCENEDFIALEPFVSRLPFETWVLPKQQNPCFETISDAEIKRLASLFKNTLHKIKKALNDPPYNWMIHTLPINGKETDSFHWHIEIIPHLTRIAGFELGTGFYQNQTPPETAAQVLRGVK